MKTMDVQSLKVDYSDLNPQMKEAIRNILRRIDHVDDINVQIDLPNKSLIICKKHLPNENGRWEDEPGNSPWIVTIEYIPKKSNPENQTWGEICDEYGIDSVKFENGELNLRDVCKGEVKIEGFSTNRADNFDKADIALAEKRGCTPEEVAEWRKENKYTWHEMGDMKTMQKVPSKIHNNIIHSGGIAAKKSMEA